MNNDITELNKKAEKLHKQNQAKINQLQSINGINIGPDIINSLILQTLIQMFFPTDLDKAAFNLEFENIFNAFLNDLSKQSTNSLLYVPNGR